jgi:Tol biopolymer transport system component
MQASLTRPGYRLPRLLPLLLVALLLVAACGDGEEAIPASPAPSVTAVAKSTAESTTPAASPTTTAPCGGEGKIAFISGRDGNNEIYVMNADGSGQTNLTNHPAYELGQAWSPDGCRIAFYSDRDGNVDIHVMNADGSGLARLTDHPGMDTDPAWSPDGSRIAFQTDRNGSSEIYVMNADGSRNLFLTAGRQPAWSPSGASIVFTSDRYGSAQVYVIDLQGPGRSSPSRISDEGPAAYPAWSPDGSLIAFASGPGGHLQIHVAHPAGTGLTRLTNSETNDFAPVWSPDGSRIVFHAIRELPPVREGLRPSYRSDIYVVNADGSGLVRLTEDPSFASYPAWSPAQ